MRPEPFRKAGLRPPREAKRREPAEYAVVALKDCPTPDSLHTCESPQHAADYWRLHIATMPHYDPEKEWLVVLLLNARKRIKGHHVVAVGLLDQVLVHAREVFRAAIIGAAHSLVLMHNHPGGDPAPSDVDLRVTRDLIRAGQLLKLEVTDHIIVTPHHHCSLKGLGFFHQ